MGKEWDKLWRNQSEADQAWNERVLTESDGLTVRRRNLPDLKSTGIQMQEFHQQWAIEALRVAKPGAMMFCFGGTRTAHRIACGIEDAGWEIRDTMMWIYGSGFPKSYNISKGIDKHFGAEREVIGKSEINIYKENKNYKFFAEDEGNPEYEKGDITAPATEEAKLWDGWGTALKPAFEPIIIAMKPREGSYVENALKYGVAGLNIDGARVPTEGDNLQRPQREGLGNVGGWASYIQPPGMYGTPDGKGRWPANLIHDGIDMNGAQRFFYTAKASKAERNAGLEGMEKLEKKTLNDYKRPSEGRTAPKSGSPMQNNHPTVKPLSLMVYLAKLSSTPTGGIVLDPFMGSGTTGMACKQTNREFIGIELDPHYFEIAEKRIASIIQVELL